MVLTSPLLIKAGVSMPGLNIRYDHVSLAT